MKKYIAYAVAALVGFHLRWIAAQLAGWTSYTMNGKDIIVAALCVVAMWSFNGAFLQKRENRDRDDTN